MRLQLSNNLLSCIGIQHVQLKKVRITISGNKMVGTVELKEVCRAALAGSYHGTLEVFSGVLVCNYCRYCILS